MVHIWSTPSEAFNITKENRWRRRESKAPSEAFDESPSAPSSSLDDQSSGTSSDEVAAPCPVERPQATIGCNGVTSGVHAFLLAAAAEWEKHQDVAELRRALLRLLQGLEQP